MVAYVPWPAGPHLARMAAEPGTPLRWLPCSRRSTPTTPRSVSRPPTSPSWVLPFKAADVVVRLAAEGQPEATLAIAKALIPVPDRRAARHRFIPVKEVASAYANLGTPIIVLFADLL